MKREKRTETREENLYIFLSYFLSKRVRVGARRRLRGQKHKVTRLGLVRGDGYGVSTYVCGGKHRVAGLGLVRGDGFEVRTCVRGQRHKVTRLGVVRSDGLEVRTCVYVAAGTGSQG